MTRTFNLLLFLIVLSLESNAVYAQALSGSVNSFITKTTSKAAPTVVKELKQNIEKRGMVLFGEIAHHAEAEKVGEKLRFTNVIIFGNPKIGTLLMQCDQQIGYELPLRILIATNKEGQTLVSFKDPKIYGTVYELRDCAGILEKISTLLNELTSQVL